MNVSAEAWTIAGLVTGGWVLLLAGTCALVVRRAWKRADSAKRDEIRGNWRTHRTGLLASIPLRLAGSTVGVFAVALLVASLAPQASRDAGGDGVDIVKVGAGMLATIGLVMIGAAYLMKWQADKGYLLGNVAYPMGKDALDPELNRTARERDLEVGRRQAARLWSLWPVYLGVSVAAFVTVIVMAIVS